MIFILTHKHEWALTASLWHGERVSQCLRCGDCAYGVDYSETESQDLATGAI